MTANGGPVSDVDPDDPLIIEGSKVFNDYLPLSSMTENTQMFIKLCAPLF